MNAEVMQDSQLFLQQCHICTTYNRLHCPFIFDLFHFYDYCYEMLFTRLSFYTLVKNGGRPRCFGMCLTMCVFDVVLRTIKRFWSRSLVQKHHHTCISRCVCCLYCVKADIPPAHFITFLLVCDRSGILHMTRYRQPKWCQLVKKTH